MSSEYEGSYVVAWAQTEVDGIEAPPVEMLVTGAQWRWRGHALRIDRPGVLRLEGALGQRELSARAGRIARRMVGELAELGAPMPLADLGGGDDLPQQAFLVTDGRARYVARVLPPHLGRSPMVLFEGRPPRAGADLWIVQAALTPASLRPSPQGVICFSAGTLLDSAKGKVPVESLRPGDLVQTADDGLQPVLWRGSERIGGARLFLNPDLRPIRIRAGAIGVKGQGGDLAVSPEHRMMLKGRAAQDLFGVDEVLVRAQDLLDEGPVARDHAAREVTYIHLMLDRHQILFANGLETESYHPDLGNTGNLAEADAAALQEVLPEGGDYGAPVRRLLTPAEAAILRYGAH